MSRKAVIWQGMLLTWCGDYNTAVEPLEKALRLNPGNPTLPLLFLGHIHEEKGARKVLAMDPGWTLEKFLARPPMNLVPANVTAFSDHLHQASLP